MILFEDVHKAFGRNHVLSGCTLDVRDGETLTIIGGSGTGKSVTLKLMLGLLKADDGRIVVDGQDITGMNEDELSGVQRNFSYQSGATQLLLRFSADDSTAADAVTPSSSPSTGRLTR